MLYGGFDHTVDKKGRVFVPAKFREDLGESFIICKAIATKTCLCIYPYNEWEKLVARISELPSAQAAELKRFLFDGAFNVEFDAQGRIVVPPALREYAKLDASAHLIGMNSYVELWSSELWSEESKYNLESIFAAADKFGI